MLKHERAQGDTRSAFATQLKRDGVPTNLTDRMVKFYMATVDAYDSANSAVAAGTVIVDNQDALISDAEAGIVQYDFKPAEVSGHGIFRGWWRVYDAPAGTEPDTYPSDDLGIEVQIFPVPPVAEPAPGFTTADLVDLAKAPLRTRTAEGSVQERTIDELIKMDQYIKGQEVGGAPWGIRIAVGKPPSTLS